MTGGGKGWKLINIFCGDHAIIKFIFLIISLLLIYKDLYSFFVLKPTFTKKSVSNFTKVDFPLLIVCPNPAFDVDEMNALGYDDIYSYKVGISGSLLSHQISVIGWDGNQTDSVKNVSERISVLKTSKDCPNDGFFTYRAEEDDEKFQGFEMLTFQLARAMYPYHLCCKVDVPQAAQKYPIAGVRIGISNKSYNSFRVLVSDQVSYSVFQQHNMRAQGQDIKSPETYSGHNTYKLKIYREVSLETDPNVQCIDYENPGDFDQCLKDEFTRQMGKFINCTAPWMTGNEEMWCRGEHASDLMDISFGPYADFMNDLSFGQANHGLCLNPCKKYNYLSTALGFIASNDVKGVTLYFDRTIDETVSEFQIGFLTLLGRFGGIIGLTKNLLWIILLVMSITSYFLVTMKPKSDRTINHKA